MTPDQYGHADAWMNPPAPAGTTDGDAWVERHPGARVALAVRCDGPGPGPRAICLTPEQRQVLRGALVIGVPGPDVASPNADDSVATPDA